MAEIFRKVALARMASPEQLDHAVRIIKPRNWIALAGAGLLFVVALVWSLVGSIDEKVSSIGVLLSSGQIYAVNAQSTGTIRDIFIQNGDSVKNGQVIARMQRTDLLDQIQVASQKHADLQNEYEIIVRQQSGKANLSNQQLTEKGGNLKAQRIRLYRQRDTLSESERKMKELFADGLITQQQLLNTQNELSSVENQIQEIGVMLSDLQLSRIQESGEKEKQFLSREQAIEESRKQLEILQINYKEQTKITAPLDGTVFEVSVSRGDGVTIGTPIAMIEPEESNVKKYQAVLYFNAQDGKKIVPGMNIAISPSIVKQEDYGFIRGIVTSVSAFPVSSRYIEDTFHHDGLVSLFTRIGTPIEVRADLIPDPSSVSGYKWSSSKGPEVSISSGIICTGSVIVKKQHPFSLIIPILKKKLLGVGDEKIGVPPGDR